MSLTQVIRPAETFHLMDGWTTTEEILSLFARHGEGMNAVCLDGHARWLTSEQAYEVLQDDRGVHYYRFISADR
jgi:prepilin-type processing-associated H-X9-DG protein